MLAKLVLVLALVVMVGVNEAGTFEHHEHPGSVEEELQRRRRQHEREVEEEESSHFFQPHHPVRPARRGPPLGFAAFVPSPANRMHSPLQDFFRFLESAALDGGGGGSAGGNVGRPDDPLFHSGGRWHPVDGPRHALRMFPSLGGQVCFRDVCTQAHWTGIALGMDGDGWMGRCTGWMRWLQVGWRLDQDRI